MNPHAQNSSTISSYGYRAFVAALLATIAAIPLAARAQDAPTTTDEQQIPVAEAQEPITEESDENAVAQDDNDDPPPPSALVVEVKGTAHWAAPGTSPILTEGWTLIEAGNTLIPGTLIRTGLRTNVNLQFGETTTVSIRSASYASIDQFFRSATTETIRVGLGYGTVRGGSSEGEIRADVEVTAPVATLAKRGTEGWEINVEGGSGRFRISLADHGLVQAIKSKNAQRIASRSVRPGQYATHSNIANMWINQDIFDRNVAFYDANFLTRADAKFQSLNTTGYATLDPAGGNTLSSLSGRTGAGFAGTNRPDRDRPLLPIGQLTPISRPEGNFGTAAIFKRR